MFASYTAHFTKSASTFNLAFENSEGNWEAIPNDIQNKISMAELALNKFEQNFNHHSKVHVDMVTVEYMLLCGTDKANDLDTNEHL